MMVNGYKPAGKLKVQVAGLDSSLGMLALVTLAISALPLPPLW